MASFDWKATVNAIAPAIGTALGGPLGGIATKALLSVFGLDQSASDDQISAAVQGATPDQLLALKKADNDFKVQMKQLDIDLAKLQFADVASARQLQQETKDWTPRLLALVTFFGFFGVLAFVGFHGLPAGVGGSESVTLLLGTLGTILTQIVAFYFGSSAGSAKKDDTIKAAVSK